MTWKATVSSYGKARRVYQTETPAIDTIKQLADIVGLDANESTHWLRQVGSGLGDDDNTDNLYYQVSVPNVFISANLLQGGDPIYTFSGMWDHTVNLGGTIGRFVGTDLFTYGYMIVKPDSVAELQLFLAQYKGSIWGMVVFGHGNPQWGNIPAGNGLYETGATATTGQVQQATLRNLVQANGYKLAKIAMMQCYSAASGNDQAWESLTMPGQFIGYQGMNVGGVDMRIF